ncbi:MAG: nucleotidyltransferase domain-containing protein [Candidatus Eremiobacteraeota bacterium]|nr:nucleotidyltransferase domain-containing protein [Candidatus Eremiobacteraeota bacterium]MCL5054408.1 nucleotidyltransferase domain-containing protein [Bacillota bacterium]
MAFRNTNRIKKKILQWIQPFSPEKVYLFGSWARNEADELSDLDLVIIKKTSAPFFERLRQASECFPAEAGAVDLFVYTPEEFSQMKEEGNVFIQTIEEEGNLIFG